MSGWLGHRAPPQQVDITALTDAFMTMDASISQVQNAVRDYLVATGDHSLDLPWNAVLARCEEAITTYLSINAPETHPTQIPWLAGRATGLIREAAKAIETFKNHYAEHLNHAANILAQRAVEAQKAAEEARKAQAEADRRARELPAEAQRALASISTRIAATRNRLNDTPAALSTMYREYATPNSADLTNNPDNARNHIDQAANYLSQARTAQHLGNPQQALTLARQTRDELTQADQLITAITNRLHLLNELRNNPKKRANQTRFTLHDAQMYAVDHHLTQQWATILDAQLCRIETLENTLNTRHPNYWAYNSGLDKVDDFIQSTVTKMRQATAQHPQTHPQSNP